MFPTRRSPVQRVDPRRAPAAPPRAARCARSGTHLGSSAVPDPPFRPAVQCPRRRGARDGRRCRTPPRHRRPAHRPRGGVCGPARHPEPGPRPPGLVRSPPVATQEGGGRLAAGMRPWSGAADRSAP